MKTHGGRAFLHGHLFGDNVHEFLAPCIYEGEGEMLGMAFFKSLVKQHGTQFFEPIGKALAAAGIRKPNMMNPAHAWALRGPLMEYAKWFAAEKLRRKHADIPSMPGELRPYAEFAAAWLGRSSLEISGLMRKYQLSLADRQCRMAEVSARVQDAITILATSLYAARQPDELVRQAGMFVCDNLQDKLLGRRASDRSLKVANRLGEAIADGGFSAIAGVASADIMMGYSQ
jgi:hypothetical protein